MNIGSSVEDQKVVNYYQFLIHDFPPVLVCVVRCKMSEYSSRFVRYFMLIRDVQKLWMFL